MASRLALALAFAALLFTYSVHCTESPAKDSVADKKPDDDDEDLSFLEEADDKSAAASGEGHKYPEIGDEEEYDGDFDNFSDFDESEGNQEEYTAPEVDEKDVVVLKERNFTDVIENNKFVMVEFYAPWCGHCQALAPEYAAAATELKAENVVLAKVDGSEENELAHEYDVQGFPTIFFFVDGVRKPYTGQRNK